MALTKFGDIACDESITVQELARRCELAGCGVKCINIIKEPEYCQTAQGILEGCR